MAVLIWIFQRKIQMGASQNLRYIKVRKAERLEYIQTLRFSLHISADVELSDVVLLCHYTIVIMDVIRCPVLAVTHGKG